jgi:hypothetical protein
MPKLPGTHRSDNEIVHDWYLGFPIELQRIAGEAIKRDYCPDIAKLAEGGLNKVFILRAKNGREVIARIPAPIAGPRHYTTASEVATMDFLRNVLKLPVPQALGYPASSDNFIGAEYVLMDLRRAVGCGIACRICLQIRNLDSNPLCKAEGIQVSFSIYMYIAE